MTTVEHIVALIQNLGLEDEVLQLLNRELDVTHGEAMPNPGGAQNLMSTAEVAGYLRLKVGAIHAKVARGELAPVGRSGPGRFSSLLFRRSDLEGYVHSCGTINQQQPVVPGGKEQRDHGKEEERPKDPVPGDQAAGTPPLRNPVPGEGPEEHQAQGGEKSTRGGHHRGGAGTATDLASGSKKGRRARHGAKDNRGSIRRIVDEIKGSQP